MTITDLDIFNDESVSTSAKIIAAKVGTKKSNPKVEYGGYIQSPAYRNIEI
jgi:hypothetical protein